jgi:hypothetical protein
MTVHVLRDVLVSVLLPVVKLLRSGACSHLVSSPLNVDLDDLESLIPIDDKLRHSFCLVLTAVLFGISCRSNCSRCSWAGPTFT